MERLYVEDDWEAAPAVRLLEELRSATSRCHTGDTAIQLAAVFDRNGYETEAMALWERAIAGGDLFSGPHAALSLGIAYIRRGDVDAAEWSFSRCEAMCRELLAAIPELPASNPLREATRWLDGIRAIRAAQGRDAVPGGDAGDNGTLGAGVLRRLATRLRAFSSERQQSSFVLAQALAPPPCVALCDGRAGQG